MQSVHVNASREYDILIGRGLIGRTGQLMAERFKPCRVAVMTDDRVDALYGEAVCASLEEAGFSPVKFAFPNGEASKNLETLGDMLEFMAREKLSRGDMAMALGGGVVGDMAGFAASVYARGIRFVQVPTTLLAAVDSSVGGKTAVNLKAGKNLAGVFAQPSLVICDTAVLSALPEALLSDGAAEIIKYGVLADRALFDTMRAGGLTANMDDIVTECVTIKRNIVAEDEFDTGWRQLLNLGHTLGHAVEQRSGYRITHGHGVAIGMALITRAAGQLGYLREDFTAALHQALAVNGLLTACPYPAA
ncbi:MAG: 3-dehydroquinate synthase, partial [Clostridia bacterium]|nr:3-dehydroquinate synthase [Clostridia bacterium]